MIFSLAGVPPFCVFFSKLSIFISLVDAYFYLVAVFAVLTSVISALYYIRQIKLFYFEKNDNWFYFAPISKGASLVLVLTAICFNFLC